MTRRILFFFLFFFSSFLPLFWKFSSPERRLVPNDKESPADKGHCRPKAHYRHYRLNTTPNWTCSLPDLVGGPEATQFIALQKPIDSVYLPKVGKSLLQEAHKVLQIEAAHTRLPYCPCFSGSRK